MMVNRVIQYLSDEFNPIKDMDNAIIDFKAYYGNYTTKKEKFKAKADGICKLTLRFLKPAVRGTMYGGLVGFLYSYVTNNDSNYYIAEGINLGFKIDLLQYNIRVHLRLPKISDIDKF